MVVAIGNTFLDQRGKQRHCLAARFRDRRQLGPVSVGIQLGAIDKIEEKHWHAVTGLAPSVALHIPWDLVDDYAHLPTEIRAAIAAGRGGGWERVVAVFQPHRYSRTAAVGPEYAEAFDGTDVVVFTEIYAAGEEPVAGVTGAWVADGVRAARPTADVRFAATRPELVQLLTGLLGPGDLCLTMGAGDLTSLPDDLIAALGGTGVAGR